MNSILIAIVLASTLCAPSIVPQPSSVTPVRENGAVLAEGSPIVCRNTSLKVLLEPARQSFEGLARPRMILSIDTRLGEEEYILDTSHRSARIRGGSPAGVWWGMQTLLQLTVQSADGHHLAGVRICDRPQMSFRGSHLDCSRHFFTVEEIKRFIDILALHKQNVFHWHLTDNQSWRAEIRKYPELTEWSKDKCRVINEFELPREVRSGIYTQDDMREIVAYAAARQITVVPEFDIPGHNAAAIKVYRHLGCDSSWNALCAGRESTFEFIENVLDELCDIFPSEYIHLGGDEVNFSNWLKCPECLAKMKELGTDDPAVLQSYVMNRAEKYLASKGRKMIGWAEVLDGNPSPTTIMQPWKSGDTGKACVQAGFDVVLAQTNYCYFNFHQTPDPEANGESFFPKPYKVTLENCYTHDFLEGFTPQEASHVIGIESCCWTEYIPYMEWVEMKHLPRLAAICENAWNASGKTGFEDFKERLRRALVPVYEHRGYHYTTYGL